VLTGRPGFFSAGADLKVVPTLDADGQRAMVDGINGLCMAWYGLPRPVVCAVNGHAIAGGLVFALCADYRVAAADGRYGLTELRAGVPYPTMAIAVVAAELSAPAARRLVLRADLVDAADLRELGAFDEVVPNDEVLDRALAVARDLAALPSSAYAATKRRLRAPTLALAARLQAGEADPLGDAWTDADTASRAAAILRGG
jgi:enoyl-CoA hydratase